MSGRTTKSDGQPASTSRGMNTNARATNIRLDEALWVRVRVYAMKMRLTARAVVAQAITEYLARNEQKAG